MFPVALKKVEVISDWADDFKMKEVEATKPGSTDSAISALEGKTLVEFRIHDPDGDGLDWWNYHLVMPKNFYKLKKLQGKIIYEGPDERTTPFQVTCTIQ